MLHFVVKSAAFAIGAKLVHELYPPTKQTIIKTYHSTCDLLGFNNSKTHTNPTPKGKAKQPRNKLTEEEYKTIMEAYEFNNNLPKKDKINQQELCDRLNSNLNLNYSRSGYCHYFRKRIIPTFKGNLNDR